MTDSGGEPREKILKASGPDTNRLEIGMEVISLDGQPIGRVKDIGADELLIDRPLARALWVPLGAVLAIQDYSGNVRGPVQAAQVVLEVSSAHVDAQGWRHA